MKINFSKLQFHCSDCKTVSKFEEDGEKLYCTNKGCNYFLPKRILNKIERRSEK